MLASCFKKQVIFNFSLILFEFFQHHIHAENTNDIMFIKNQQEMDIGDSDKEIEKVLHAPSNLTTPHHKQKKNLTFITYMAGDNDLGPFGRRNLKQQTDIGSTKDINIVTQFDTKTGNKKVTKRYYIEKDRLIVTNQNDIHTQQMDSGSPYTLIDCCKWAIENYPADNYVLVLWNHGTGVLEMGQKRVNPFPLFLFNPETNLIELDRSIPFFNFIQATSALDQRAICFDDSTGHYLTNKDLEMALNTICTKFLNGKKFAIICFDACLMSMIEVANIVKNYAHYMTASQEVELGTGYDYRKILTPFLNGPLDKETFARHIVQSYETSYSTITNDYTQSALDLSKIDDLEKNVSHTASLLTKCLKLQKSKTILEAIKASRHKLFCTHFDVPSYIDLHHFYTNLLINSKKFAFESAQEGASLVNELINNIQNGIKLIEKTVVANVAGKNLGQAKGISIYFPEKKVDQSYLMTAFAATNQWAPLLQQCVV